MPQSEKYFVGPRLLGDIRETITRVAGVPYSSSGRKDAVRLQELPRGGGGGELVVSEITSQWNHNSDRVLLPKGVTATQETFSAKNTLISINPSTACEVIVGETQEGWRLVAVDLTKQPGFSAQAGQTVVLSAVSGILRWVGTTAC